MVESEVSTSTETEQLEDKQIRKILQQNLDETDYQIYKELNESGRISDTELGDRVGLSRTAARRRRKKLEEDGVVDILGVLVLQNAELAYADVRIQFESDVSNSDIEDFVARLADDEVIYEIDEYMGEYDLLVRVWHASLSDIKAYLRGSLQQTEVVNNYEATPVAKTIKAWHKKVNDLSS